MTSVDSHNSKREPKIGIYIRARQGEREEKLERNEGDRNNTEIVETK